MYNLMSAAAGRGGHLAALLVMWTGGCRATRWPLRGHLRFMSNK
jgi:hypothetical protein